MEVILCKRCEGYGNILVQNHKGEEDRVACKKCAGTGRLLKKRYLVEIPYGSKTQGYFEADKKIMQLIQNLNSTTK